MIDALSRVRPGGLVKICGVREPEHAVAAAVAGANLLGFVFAPTRRQVTAVQAARCIQAARGARGAQAFLSVGIFVNETVDHVNAIAYDAGLDVVQLHGTVDSVSPEPLKRPALIAIRPRAGDAVDVIRASMTAMMAEPWPALGFVIDGYHPTEYGGQGVRADWVIAAELASAFPLLLAGGLDHENVARAIAAVSPLGVDVSSGVETNGVKDVEKIHSFVGAARVAFERMDQVRGSHIVALAGTARRAPTK